jgi:hypothetical protein
MVDPFNMCCRLRRADTLTVVAPCHIACMQLDEFVLDLGARNIGANMCCRLRMLIT